MGRTLRHVTALGLGAASLWVAAPALSTEPYLPEAVDFSQPLGAAERIAPQRKDVGEHGHPGEGVVTHRSPVVEAPQRFDAVGLAGERRPLEIRARLEGEEWSDWIEVASGDPLYVVGGGDEAQVRARGWEPRGNLHYVNVSGTTSPLRTALTDVRQAVSTAVVAGTDLVSSPAQAAARKPKFVSRRGWGAERSDGGCRPRATPAYGVVKAVAVHHTVTSNSYSRAEGKGIVLAICRFHRNGNGWNDIGYQALVDRFGRVYAGRAGGLDRPVVGAQAQGYNAQTAGVAAIGTHSSTRAGRSAIHGLRNYIAWKLDTHGRTARGRTRLTSQGGEANRYPRGKVVKVKRIFRHGAVDYTSCPGAGLAGQLDRLRRLVARRMD